MAVAPLAGLLPPPQTLPPTLPQAQAPISQPLAQSQAQAQPLAQAQAQAQPATPLLPSPPECAFSFWASSMGVYEVGELVCVFLRVYGL